NRARSLARNRPRPKRVTMRTDGAAPARGKLMPLPRWRPKQPDPMEAAHTYEEWARLAAAYDHEHGLDDWKSADASKSYDYRSIRQRLDLIRDLRYRRDYHQLLFTLNEGVHGNLGGMGKPILYNKAKLGTKNLIHQFINEVCLALHDIDQVAPSIVSEREKQDFLLRASHCYGRSALMLSGG